MLREELIRDKIVVGIRDEKLSQKLQLDSQFSLKKAIDMVRQSESIIAQNRTLLETNSTTEVDAIKSKPKQKFKPPLHKKASNPVPAQSTHTNVKVTSDVNKRSCHRCGNEYHTRSECPAKNSTCRKCKKLGHWDKVCRSRHVNTIEENNSYAFMGLVSTNECQDIFQRKLKLGKLDVEFKIDSGADVTCISNSVFEQVQCLTPNLKLAKPDRILYGPSNTKLIVLGSMNIDIMCETTSKISNQRVYVVNDLSIPLLGQPAIKALDLLHSSTSCTTQHQQEISSLNTVVDNNSEYVKQYPKLFSGLGKLSGDYTIRLREDAVSYAVVTSRAVKLPQYEKLKAEIDIMLK
ncbi:hypothetical protein SNE40_006027 [Patella caerulea]|uniref:CCHC-type domain-containing protein n=2 Tax=Patella caerulea TaxID=87958 RepID=A0AAN8JZJ0_PATCE